MKLASLTYGTIAGSPFHGALAIHVEFGRNGVDVDQVEFVNKIVNYPQNTAFPAVVFTGELGSIGRDEPMLDVVQALTDWNYNIFIQCDGTIYPTWFGVPFLKTPSRGYITVTLDQRPWLMFECQEIRLVFSDVATPEPKMPQNVPRQLYVMPTQDSLIKDAVRFIRESENPWALYVPRKTGYLEDIEL